MGVEPQDVERAKRYYETYTATEPSLTLRIWKGEFGEASKNYLIYKKAKEYAREREFGEGAYLKVKAAKIICQASVNKQDAKERLERAGLWGDWTTEIKAFRDLPDGR